MKTIKEIRNEFFEFFKSKNHLIIPSAPVVPFEDQTLLFTNAGMNQFKDIFLGKTKSSNNRIANTQKCIRLSGKHNDLEEVGLDTYHHTFFEMLGNWSFGDPNSIDGIGSGYYKEDAIKWAWELLTEVWGLPKERLYATVFKTDDEAFNCWKTVTDINPSHILRFDEKDNFWEMGEIGPCGPCSEIHINLSDDYNDASLVNAGSSDCIEIWNLVFIQYNRKSDGTLEPLKAKHVDTGMGFERIVAVLQNKNSNYDTDIFQPLIHKIEELTGKKYLAEENKVAMRVISDHIRTLTFAISDGALPGNEGRGYVLRRLLRRASRYARKLDIHEPILFKLVDTLVELMGEMFPEIVSHRNQIKEIIKAEEESFGITLDRGIEIFDSLIREGEKNNNKIINGEQAFKLYDTFGFPLDLTILMANENGFIVDEKRFQELMSEQKERSRTSGKFTTEETRKLTVFTTLPDTEFTGYSELETKSKILYFDEGMIVLDRTPFYAESGGQVGDTGEIFADDEIILINDTQKEGNIFIHKTESSLKKPLSKPVIALVNKKRRKAIMRNHSATHLLHTALRKVLGEHVKQAGSYVDQDRLRFDFTHYKKLEKIEINDLNVIVNEKIRESLSLYHHKNISLEEAKKMGALMFFGEKYGERVNVVQFGDFTMEFCGGTHVSNTSEIGLFRIITESSISSGIRRIEAVTGEGVEKFLNEQLSKIDNLTSEIDNLIEEKKKLEKELRKLKLQNLSSFIDDIIKNAKKINDFNLIIQKVDVDDIENLKKIGDEVRTKLKNGIAVLASVIEGKVTFVCVVTDNLIKSKGYDAGKIVKELAKMVGGGGGGKAHLATAGGKDIEKFDFAMSMAENVILNYKI